MDSTAPFHKCLLCSTGRKELDRPIQGPPELIKIPKLQVDNLSACIHPDDSVETITLVYTKEHQLQDGTFVYERNPVWQYYYDLEQALVSACYQSDFNYQDLQDEFAQIEETDDRINVRFPGGSSLSIGKPKKSN